ncbi:MAG: diadenylate cyclase CdaA [Erysipelotrichaceae bacterium]
MSKYLTLSNLIQVLKVLLDIGIVWVLVYYTLKIVKTNTKTVQIFKGIIVVIIIKAFANTLGLKTLDYLATNFVTWGFLAVIIIFQPEIRGLLENLGKTSVFSRINTLTTNEREHLVTQLDRAVRKLSREKTGAIISIEQGTSLSEFVKTGTSMNSIVTSELLCSIFQPGTPLHDGAVIIQGDKIACASAYFPPTSLDYPSSYGARHRAAIGISEISDSLTIVVSEETGTVSVAEKGKLTPMSFDELHEYLMHSILLAQNEVQIKEKVVRRTYNEHVGEDVVVSNEKEGEENVMASLFHKARNMISAAQEATQPVDLIEPLEIVDLTEPKQKSRKRRKSILSGLKPASPEVNEMASVVEEPLQENVPQAVNEEEHIKESIEPNEEYSVASSEQNNDEETKEDEEHV